MKKICVLIGLLVFGIGRGQTGCMDSIEVISNADAALGYHDGTNSWNMNYGNALHCSAFVIPGTAGPYNGNRGLYKFDMSSIPVTATITSASMSLYVYPGPIGVFNGQYGSANASYLQRVTSAWTETTVTWNTQPSATPVTQVFLPGSTNAAQNYLNIDVTALTQDIFNSSGNNGYMLRLVNEQATNIMTFCSREYTVAAQRPKLKVKYIKSTPVNLSITGNNMTCAGSAITQTVSGANTYTWSTGSTVPGISVSPTVTTTYSVTGTNSIGCTGTAVKTISVNPLPVLVVTSASSVICSGETTTLTASGANFYSWNTGSNTGTIFVAPSVTATYTVAGSDMNGCGATAVITQSVSGCVGINELELQQKTLQVFPNPNNGKFVIRNDTYFSEKASIEIRNVSGQIIFQSPVKDNEIEINVSFADGIYIVRIVENGVPIGISKFIIQN